MRIVVQLFAAAKELASSDTVEVQLPEPATVGDLRRELVAAVPALAGMSDQLKFAVDEEYASDETPIRQGANVACIPPVSGG